MAKVLKHKKVISLSLEGNPIGVSGASAFAEELSFNTSPIKLDLNCESIGPEGTQMMISCLEKNYTLETLRLPWEHESSVRTSAAYQRVKDGIEWGRTRKWFVLLPVDLYDCVSITIAAMYDGQ